MRLAVLVSGTGTILDAIVEAGIEVSLVLSDRACPALDKARALGIGADLVERHDFGAEFDRDAYSSQIVESLESHQIDLVAMAGFGTVLSSPAHAAYGGRILNTHPALLPSFKGWHAVRDALAYGVKVTGCTVHLAGLAVDTGPILAQEAIPVLPGDTESTLHERIKAVERQLYPEAISAFMLSGAAEAPERTSLK